ncbi:MAG: hypothetical protein ACR2MD_06460 [Aridibacter sp.]
MNSEELELSLRTEFENYLKDALADMKQEVSDFQEKIETELDEQKTRIQEKLETELDEQKTHFSQIFNEFTEKFEADKKLEDSFTESVVEHLKLARDEGARITATAIAEAEKLAEEEELASPAASANFTELRDAINEISNKGSQSEILKSLVDHASQYTPRGAFFIVKNEHLVGWRVFGREEHSNPQAVREVFFPIDSDTALSESVKTLETVESSFGSYEDDSVYLNQLDFEKPEKMYAIPLIARGRGVAVLYADAGTNGDNVNAEALETLVRVAGLTVEVLASSKGAKPQIEQDFSYETEDAQEFEERETEVSEIESDESYSFVDTAAAAQEFTEDYSSPSVEEDNFSYQQEFQAEPDEEYTEKPQSEETEEDSFAADDSFEEVKTEETSTGFEFTPVEETFEAVDESFEDVSEEEEKSSEGDFSWTQSSETLEESQDFSSDETEPEVDYAPYESTTEEDSVSSVEDYQSEINQPYEMETPVQFDDSKRFEFETTSDIQTDDYSIIEESQAEETDSSFDAGYQETTTATKNDEAEQDYSQTPVEAESVSTTSVRPRFGDRNVDLPIEVSEDERRLHNDARRFARLLVSEIKLYNEQKVKEGRESSDLYERLREAIDRSREMYDKRVQPPVAAKFDYFHYELINTLAEGEENNLGGSYPGTTV